MSNFYTVQRTESGVMVYSTIYEDTVASVEELISEGFPNDEDAARVYSAATAVFDLARQFDDVLRVEGIVLRPDVSDRDFSIYDTIAGAFGALHGRIYFSSEQG